MPNKNNVILGARHLSGMCGAVYMRSHAIPVQA